MGNQKRESLKKNALKAAAYFEKAGQPDCAASFLEKIALDLEKSNFHDDCLVLLEKAAKIVEIENRPIQSAYFITKILKIKLQINQIDEAIQKAMDLIRLYQVKFFLACNKPRETIILSELDRFIMFSP